MAQFTDTRGNAWEVSITVEALKRVRSLTGVDLGNIHQGDPPTSARLDLDPMLLIDVIYSVIKPQADAKNISDIEFGESLGGEAAFAARQAFWGSLIDFFQGYHRSEVVAILTKQLDLTTKVIQQATAQVEAMQIDEVIERAKRISGKSSTAMQESSESTPGP